MASPEKEYRVSPITITAPTNREFFLIHGYTGSPTDFNVLSKELHAAFNAHVNVMLLPGHGTRVEDLDSVTLEQILEPLEKELQKELAAGREIVIGGLSFGAQLALYLASKYPVVGAFGVSTSNRLRFPFTIPGIGILGRFKKYWPKFIPEDERAARIGAFFYDKMHANGFFLSREMARRVERTAPTIAVPTMLIHSTNDLLASNASIAELVESIGTYEKELVTLDVHNHNLFYSPIRDTITADIINFFKTARVFEREKRHERASAIISAYNEGPRIGPIIECLLRTPAIDEVIVVDDGSRDTTSRVASAFAGVVYVRHAENRGKAAAMDTGVRIAKNNIIFFCDADVEGLTPAIVNGILRPIQLDSTDMSIGVRDNFMQRAVTLFALNSGERALRKELWGKLPAFFKYRYSIEAGLNYIAKKHGRGFVWKKFPYTQPLKEKKYGLIRGTLLRWWMNIDVALAYARCSFLNLQTKNSDSIAR